MGPDQTYKLSHCKGDHKTKRQPRNGKKYLQMTQPIREQFPKYTNSSYFSVSKKPTSWKMGRRYKYTFLQRHTDVQQAHEKNAQNW